MNKILILTLLFITISCGDSHIVNDSSSRIENARSGCPLYFQTEGLCLKAEWEVFPTESTFGSMILTFADENDPDRLITPKNDPYLILWMPSMGHGSSPVTVEFIETGKYRVNDVFFIMPGPWDIRYQLKSLDEIIDETIQKINI